MLVRTLALLVGLCSIAAATEDLIELSPSDLFAAETAEAPVIDVSETCPATCRQSTCDTWWWGDELTLFGGLDGSKQPQDFGVNANLGGQAHFNWGLPLSEQYGVGMQVGHAIVHTDNAVRVFELMGEAKNRTQNYTTIGLFQRTDNGFAWGFAHDWLQEESFDDFQLRQWRVRGMQDLGRCDQVGVTVNLYGEGSQGLYNTTAVRLEPIEQGSLFWRHWWPTGAQTTCWGGLAAGHGEDNAVTGPSPRFGESYLMGADILTPLNNYLAIYGETNLIFPADSGTVDAFLGVQFYPGGKARRARRGLYSPLLPVASPTAFSVDLQQ